MRKNEMSQLAQYELQRKGRAGRLKTGKLRMSRMGRAMVTWL